MTARPFYAVLVAVSALWLAVSCVDPRQAAQDAWAYALIAVLLLTLGRVAEHTENDHGR